MGSLNYNFTTLIIMLIVVGIIFGFLLANSIYFGQVSDKGASTVTTTEAQQLSTLNAIMAVVAGIIFLFYLIALGMLFEEKHGFKKTYDSLSSSSTSSNSSSSSNSNNKHSQSTPPPQTTHTQAPPQTTHSQVPQTTQPTSTGTSYTYTNLHPSYSGQGNDSGTMYLSDYGSNRGSGLGST